MPIRRDRDEALSIGVDGGLTEKDLADGHGDAFLGLPLLTLRSTGGTFRTP